MWHGCVDEMLWSMACTLQCNHTFDLPFIQLQKEVKAIEKRLEEACVVIQHLEMHVINAACDDPGTAIGSQLLLPMLQVSFAE